MTYSGYYCFYIYFLVFDGLFHFLYSYLLFRLVEAGRLGGLGWWFLVDILRYHLILELWSGVGLDAVRTTLNVIDGAWTGVWLLLFWRLERSLAAQGHLVP